MEKCNSWESQIVSSYSVSENEEKEIQRCLTTLNYEECNCNGNKENCNFNFYKKEPKTYSTAEMWLMAQKNGKTYVCEDMSYNKEVGLYDMDNKIPWPFPGWDRVQVWFDTLLSYRWKEKEC